MQIVEDVALCTLTQGVALPLVHNVESVAIPTIGSTCAAPGNPLDPHPEEQKMVLMLMHRRKEPISKLQMSEKHY